MGSDQLRKGANVHGEWGFHRASMGCRAFSVPFNRAASMADNLEFLREMLGELRRWAPACLLHRLHADERCCAW